MKNDFVLGISEVNVVECHVARKARIAYRAVLMRMLPRPYARALFALCKNAVVLLSVYKRYITVVCLGLFISQRKNSRRARKSHDNGVNLL